MDRSFNIYFWHPFNQLVKTSSPSILHTEINTSMQTFYASTNDSHFTSFFLFFKCIAFLCITDLFSHFLLVCTSVYSGDKVIIFRSFGSCFLFGSNKQAKKSAEVILLPKKRWVNNGTKNLWTLLCLITNEAINLYECSRPLPDLLIAHALSRTPWLLTPSPGPLEPGLVRKNPRGIFYWDIHKSWSYIDTYID